MQIDDIENKLKKIKEFKSQTDVNNNEANPDVFL